VSPYLAHGLDVYAPHLYWHAFFMGDYPSLDYLKSADSETVEAWMRQRASSLFKLAPGITFINVTNEPVYEYQGQLGWENNPMYTAFGKAWLKKAWHIAYEEAQKAGMDPNQVGFVFNDYNNEWPNLKSEFYRQFAVEFQNELKEENINLDHPVRIGLQFHIRTTPQDNTMWYGPDSSEITYEGLLAHFNAMGEAAPIEITELSARQSGGTKEGGALISPQEEAVLFCTVIKAAIDSGKVESIIFWDQTNQPTLINLSTGIKYLPYYEISRVFYEGLK
jgi:GH35 family endo-1,4-beta-xylanase